MAHLFTITLFQLCLGIIGIVAMFIFAITLGFFGKLIKHQIKIWLLARRGYIQIRHVREDMNEDYYFIKFIDGHYSFSGGVFMEQKDTKTNSTSILQQFNYEVLKNKTTELTELEKQIKSFFDNIKDNKIMDIKTLPWGLPTITYFGTDPQPVNFRDRKKVYDAKNIASMIKRILMTKEWKLVRIALIIGVVGIVGLLVLSVISYGVANKFSSNLAVCQQSLNITLTKYMDLVNTTIVPIQNTTINI